MLAAGVGRNEGFVRKESLGTESPEQSGDLGGCRRGLQGGGGSRRRGTGSSPAGLVGVFVFAVSL